MNFPVPFAGIQWCVKLERDELMDFLAFVGRGCDTPDPRYPEHRHYHNVAVAFDGDRIFGSELLLETCLRRWLDARGGGTGSGQGGEEGDARLRADT